ncbi:hypothetical protein ACHAWF_017339 [Thalassiosira exigua]
MKAYLAVSHGDAPLGTLRLTLRPDIVPRTVENFVHFLSGSGSGGTGGYRGSTFHRVIRGFMAQGGDIVRGDGTGSTSLYGPQFADENFLLSHSQRGTLSMANSGKDTNGCQFFVSFKAAAHLDGRHVVFGSVDWREDEESAEVLEKMERAATDRRTDRPTVPLRIAECGLIEEKRTAGEAGEGTAGGNKLAGEAKKTKLLRAYGEVDPADAADEDDDEIDLDDEEEEDDGGAGDGPVKIKIGVASSSKRDDMDDIDLDDETDSPEATDGRGERPESSDPAPAGGKPTKKAAIQKRLAALRTKINQSRTLNRREVKAEAERMGSEEAINQERRRQNKQDRGARKEEYDAYAVGKLRGGDDAGGGGADDDKAERKKAASLSQPAYDSIQRMNKRADREERARYGPDDHYNPEGQHSNYERNLNAVRRAGPRRGGGAATLDSYDPSADRLPNGDAARSSAASEREGARRLASEMKRRAEKRANKKRELDFDAADITSINDRNKRFNRKIGRNFDEHTAEIRQNLERGTAL